MRRVPRPAPVITALALAAVVVAGCVTVAGSGSGSGSTPAAVPDGSSPPTPLPSRSRAPGSPFAPASAPAPASPLAPGSSPPAADPSTAPGGRALGAPEVLGFLPYWLVDDAQIALDLERLTTLAWFGVEASGSGYLVRREASGDVPPGWEGFESQAFRDLQARAQAAGVRVVLVVQRFGWNEGGARRTAALLDDPDRRARLARQLAGVVAERGLDGVNLDIEPVPAELADELVALVREVRGALDRVRPGLQVTVDATSGLVGYDLEALTAPGAADAVVIMGYAYRGAGAATSGSQAPLDAPSGPDLRSTLEAALDASDPGTLVLALPWYGRAWSTETDEPGARVLKAGLVAPSETVTYAQAAELAEGHGRRLEPGQVSAWTAVPTVACSRCGRSWRQAWYEDPDTFGAKTELALDAGLAGIGIWALGHEAGRDELWSVLRWRLDGRPADHSAPVGTASLDPTFVHGRRDGLPRVGREASFILGAADGAGESGLAFVRIGLDGELDEEGSLARAITFPATDAVRVATDDPATGGTDTAGPRTIHVQWRDLAGNWSPPVVLKAWADPAIEQGAAPSARAPGSPPVR